MATSLVPTEGFSGLALAALFHPDASAVDGVVANASYIISGVGQPGKVSAQSTPSKTVTVNPFTCIVAGPSPAITGPVLWTSGTSPVDLTIDDPDATNPRIDRIYVEITQNANPATIPPTPAMCRLRMISGVAAPSPSPPAAPHVGAMLLATINVPAGSTSVIGSAQIVPAQWLGGLRGGSVVGYTGAATRVARLGQLYLDEASQRLSVIVAGSTMESIPGIGTTWPEWFLRGIPAGFTIPNAVDKVLAYATNDKASGVTIAAQTTGAVVTLNEAGSYQARCSTRWPNGNAVGERVMFLEHRNSAGVRIRRVTQSVSNVNLPQDTVVSSRFRVNAGEQIVACCFQSSGAVMTLPDIFGEYVFEGYKVMDL